MEVQAAFLILSIFHDSKPSGKDIILIGHLSLDKEFTIRERVGFSIKVDACFTFDTHLSWSSYMCVCVLSAFLNCFVVIPRTFMIHDLFIALAALYHFVCFW
jgi:hypothetical protein